MTAILFLWTIVGLSGQYGQYHEYDWRPMGEFASVQDCQRAAAQLAVKADRFRCVPTGKKP